MIDISLDKGVLEGKLDKLNRAKSERTQFGYALAFLAAGVASAFYLGAAVLGFVFICLLAICLMCSFVSYGDFKEIYLEYWQETGLSANEASDKYYNEYPPIS